MSLDMPVLVTPRLAVRPFTLADLQAVHRVLDVDLEPATGAETLTRRLTQRRAWLEWSVRNYAALATLHQPPYGDRAVTLRATGEVIGAAGFAPVLAPMGQLGKAKPTPADRLFTAEVGLFWAIAPRHRRQGYAAEAGRALIDYAFTHLHLRQVVATTEHANQASQGVMLKLGMRLERNEQAEPEWFQVVGVLENRGA